MHPKGRQKCEMRNYKTNKNAFLQLAIFSDSLWNSGSFLFVLSQFEVFVALRVSKGSPKVPNEELRYK